MLSLKTVIALAVVACGFVSADLTPEQKKKCTFGCVINVQGRRLGGCTTITDRDQDGTPIQWQIKKANPTDGFEGYYNCLETKADLSSCCAPGSIMYPPSSDVMILNGLGAYKKICTDAKPLDPGLGRSQGMRLTILVNSFSTRSHQVVARILPWFPIITTFKRLSLAGQNSVV
ncbi:hypothetical protein KEM48_008259 [Puccinia striiformis f. sp. tritici PST-130]|nr:hypothetical protein KEM48_008259 [Puccinia striiformis f. sp. tritici PST-130]